MFRQRGEKVRARVSDKTWKRVPSANAGRVCKFSNRLANPQPAPRKRVDPLAVPGPEPGASTRVLIAPANVHIVNFVNVKARMGLSALAVRLTASTATTLLSF